MSVDVVCWAGRWSICDIINDNLFTCLLRALAKQAEEAQFSVEKEEHQISLSKIRATHLCNDRKYLITISLEQNKAVTVER